MISEIAVLGEAKTEVDQERASLRSEQKAFEEFREGVRLATVDSADGTDASETSAKLLERYRESVLKAPEYEEAYGDTLAESLEEEFSPAVADGLLSNAPFTQQRKRNLLVQASMAVERRETFLEELDGELEALQSFAEELRDINSTIDGLPECSPRQQPLEELLVIWEVYDDLKRRCDRLLERRQRQLREGSRSGPDLSERHALNGYLYGALHTRYPVLSAIAETCQRIDARRGQPVETAGPSLES